MPDLLHGANDADWKICKICTSFDTIKPVMDFAPYTSVVCQSNSEHMSVSDRQYRRLHQSPAIPYAWAREAARRLDLGLVDRASMKRLPVGLIKDGGPGKMTNQEHIPDALWSFHAEKSDLVMLALEFQRQRQWYFSLRLALYLFVHIVSLCEARTLTRASGIPVFVMAVTYTGDRPWVPIDGNELWTDTARQYMTMPDFPILYYDVRHCEPQDLPDTAELRIMMEGERELQHHTLYGHKLARELQLLEDPESRDVLARFLAEFSEHWPRHISQPDGTLQLVEVKWDRVQTAEDYLMATSVYSDAFSRLRQDLREEVREEVREGLREEVREEVREDALREGRQEDALKILGTVLEQDQLASLARAWRQSGWFPNLDAVLAVRDGTQSWTFLLPTESPPASNNS